MTYARFATVLCIAVAANGGCASTNQGATRPAQEQQKQPVVVVEKQPAAKPPAQAGASPAPRMVPVTVARLLIDPQKAAYRPFIPPKFRSGNITWGLYKLCVSAEGRVQTVAPIKRMDPPEVDPYVAAAIIKTWRYQPYAVDGKPVPYCYPLRYELRLQ